MNTSELMLVVLLMGYLFVVGYDWLTRLGGAGTWPVKKLVELKIAYDWKKLLQSARSVTIMRNPGGNDVDPLNRSAMGIYSATSLYFRVWQECLAAAVAALFFALGILVAVWVFLVNGSLLAAVVGAGIFIMNARVQWHWIRQLA